jgi:hypothetical protein
MKRLLIAIAAALCFSPAAAETEGEINPALFVVRDADSTMYLYGTVHELPEGAPWASPAVRAALDEADEVWTETNFYDSDLQRRFAADLEQALATRAETPLTRRLNAQQAARMIIAGKALGMTREYIDGLKPWMAALFLIGTDSEGLSHDAGVDQQIINLAIREGVARRWLEESGVAELDGLPDAVQMEFLIWILEASEANAAAGDAMWRRGDLEAMYETEIAPMREDYPNLYGWIVVQRNTAWMERLVAEMEGSGVDFVAVGAAHLAGPDSLKAMFEARGYVVERVTPMGHESQR